MRFRIFIPDAALLTLKGLREAVLSFARHGTVSRRRFHDLQNDLPIIFTEADLNRIDEPLPYVGSNLETIDQDVGRLFEVHVQQRFRLRIVECRAILVKPAEASPLDIR